MTDVNCLTSEHTTTTTSTATTTTPTKNVLEQTPSPTSPFVLRAPPSAKSKLILQNMEEVLNSVKQKHREKHKRKREEKRRAALLAEAEAETEAEQSPRTPTTKTPAKTNNNGRHVPSEQRPQPLREKTARENGLGNTKRKPNSMSLKSSTPIAGVGAMTDQQTSIMKHFVKTVTPPATAAATAKTKTATNVFELMMNARNRSLGSNADGQQQSPEQESGDGVAQANSTPLVKRKELLQDWNERKGGAKRRLADEARGEYIEKQMDQRAKRLKKMLTQPEQANSKQQVEVLSTSLPAKRARGRPRTRRPSADAIPEPDSQNIDTDTVEFLSKLSSPTKKRDSLLGYFPKMESPKNPTEHNKIEMETPKTRRSRGAKNTMLNTPVTVEQPTTTPSGRPRRSCATKARYDYDLELSPPKAKPTVETKTTTTAAAAADVSIEIIDLDNSNPVATPMKLAPLFMRHMPKPSPDPTVLRARQEFLHSGVPEKLKQEQQRQRCNELYYEESYELFPRIAHVGAGEIGVPKSTAAPLRYVLREEVEELQSELKTIGKCSAGSITNCIATDYVAMGRSRQKVRNTSWTPLPLVDNKRALVKNWKSVFDRFPTFKCYNQMREKYRHFSAIDAAQDTQPMGESFVVTRRTRRSMEAQKQQLDQQQQELDDKPPAMAPNGELLFTEKYKPLLFEQVLVNLSPVQELRDFLSNWNSAGNRNSQTVEDTSTDFSNDSTSSISGASCNTMVLLGPCSSGKTNAVFALANDMNFNVLEVNAGMKRNGKKLIQELQEATQSHQIRKDAKAGGAQLLQKLQLSGLKAKRQQSEDEVRKSLILIEDADILFENTDAGFTDAIYTLAASSKRPVIIVATDSNCAHLQRLIQQNMIRFQAPNALNISRFLAVLALMENCPIELDDLVSLYLYNNHNLRKTLMELQFFVQSGGDGQTSSNTVHQLPTAAQKSSSRSPVKSPRLSPMDGVRIHQRLFEFYTCAQNIHHRIPFPVDFRLLRLNVNEFIGNSRLLQEQSMPVSGRGKRKSRSPKKAWLSTATQNQNEPAKAASPLETLANFYEHLSTAEILGEQTPCDDRLQPNLSDELAHALVEGAVSTCLASKDYVYNLFDKPMHSIQLVDQLGSCCLRTSSARALDLEPAMRSICRSEKQRAGVERRSSRFYHYLRNHTINNLTNFSNELYDEACDVLQEREESSTSKLVE